MSRPRQNPRKILKKFSSYAILKKPQKWGQIWNITESRQIICQKKALDIRLSMKLVLRSFGVTQGQKMPIKGHKGRISIFIKSSRIIDEKKALKVGSSKTLVWRSFKVTQGQKLPFFKIA